ncbi:unnamed protein product [Vitrella brassicaformis CCMP3155]|uniref:Reticulon-like protein n=2 Tax=Vitrella brassicaformis TaxID=1169539 RepID=A0A0G4FGM1_VITBC|nr:unnamed protein product [Vitrella brassicaformis CCMP3155]|mmetsp:Transcript_41475/g.103528  ORF Transcript_41475/g.103528 Transcript_41475/m.103528 type:complete len:181 (+) Transcript_41475:65-607(+)|eukprot:CEM12634.1 unnamed protein product [Vitrella brassicaformis CCMP3155]
MDLKGLVTWKNKVTSSCALFALNLLLVLLTFGGCSLLTIAAWLTMTFIMIGFVLGLDVQGAEEPKYEYVDKNTIKDNLDYLYDVTNDAAGTAREVLLWKNWMLSLKVLVGAFVAQYIGRFFNTSFLIFIGIWLLFLGGFLLDFVQTKVWPEVKPHYDTAITQVKDAYNKIPRLSDVKKTD